MPQCEIATLPMKAGVDFQDKSGAGKLFDDMHRIITSQPGIEDCWYGFEVENPNVLQMFINWTSIKDHQNFMASSDYPVMLKNLETIMDGAPDLYHVDFLEQAHLKAAITAPVTEVVTLHFASKDSNFESNMQKFSDVAKNAQGCFGLAGGWSVEDVEHEKLEGQKGKIFLVTIGWQSVEAHMAFRETDAFKDNIGLFREGPKASEMHHVKIQSGA